MSRMETLIQAYLGVKHRAIGVIDRSPAEAYRMVERGAAVLDVREAVELDWARLPGSLHIPLSELEERRAELSPLLDEEFLVLCHGGLRSGQACRTLHQLGFRAPVNLAGGILAWCAAGLPIEGHGRFDASILDAARRRSQD